MLSKLAHNLPFFKDVNVFLDGGGRLGLQRKLKAIILFSSSSKKRKEKIPRSR